MKQMTIICVCLFCGCAVTKPPMPNVRDSVRVEIVERVERVVDTVYLKIPHEQTSHTIRDTTSLLEVEFAHSTAAITSDGRLHHSLEQKAIQLPIETMVEVVVKDSIVYRDREIVKIIPQQTDTKESLATLWKKILTLSAILFIFVFIIRTKIF